MRKDKSVAAKGETRRVFARVLAEDLRKIHGSGETIYLPGPKEPTISEAATSESIPDQG